MLNINYFSKWLHTANGRAVLFLALALVIYLPAKWSVLQAQSEADITIGSKNFTESRIIAEIYAESLEKSGYRVRRRFDLGGTLIAHAALQRGEIDMYPEYTGTGLITVLHLPAGQLDKNPLQTLNYEYQSRWQLRWLTPAQANDSQGLVVSQATAKQYRLYTISRLQALSSKLILATIPEFEDREDGLKGLKNKYGNFAFKDIRQYDNALKYRVLLAKNADVTVGFTTDGDLLNSQLVLLEDDQHFWPEYRVAPVIREQVLKREPKIAETINRASQLLTTQTLRQLNAKVDLEKQDYRTVARQFVQEKLLKMQSLKTQVTEKSHS